MNRWDEKMGSYPWEQIPNESEEDALQDYPEEIYEPEPKVTFVPDFTQSWFYLALAGAVAALGLGAFLLLKGEDKPETKKKPEEKVPKVITRTVTKYVERKPEPKTKEKVVKEEVEEKDQEPTVIE